MNLTPSLAQHGMTVLAADGDGVLDLINNVTADAGTTIRNVAIVAAAALVLWKSWQAKAALGAVVTAGLVAALLIYVVTHVDDLGNRVNNEVNSSSAVQMPTATIDPPTAAISPLAPDTVIAPPIL